MTTPDYFLLFVRHKAAVGTTYVVLFGSNYVHKTCNADSYKISDAKVKDCVTLI